MHMNLMNDAFNLRITVMFNGIKSEKKCKFWEASKTWGRFIKLNKELLLPSIFHIFLVACYSAQSLRKFDSGL